MEKRIYPGSVGSGVQQSRQTIIEAKKMFKKGVPFISVPEKMLRS
jgi:hypothetical protein